MFEELLEMIEKKFKESDKKADYEDIIDLASKVLIEDTLSHENDTVGKVISENDAFIRRNRERWSLGFQKLHALRETSLQAGMNFQKQLFLDQL